MPKSTHTASHPCDPRPVARICAATNARPLPKAGVEPTLSRRVNVRDGISVDGVPYCSPAFHQLHGSILEIQVDLDDVSRVFARVDDSWVECRADAPLSLQGVPRRVLKSVCLSRSSSKPKGGRHHD